MRKSGLSLMIIALCGKLVTGITPHGHVHNTPRYKNNLHEVGLISCQVAILVYNTRNRVYSLTRNIKLRKKLRI